MKSDEIVRACSETLITPEQFAELLCDDLELPSGPFVPAISSSIRQQCEQFSTDMIPEDEEDRRVIIKVGEYICIIHTCTCNASLFVGVGRYKYIDHLLISIAFLGGIT